MEQRAERFLTLFRKLEGLLEKRYDGKRMSSGSVVMEYLHDPDSAPCRTDLDLCREIRNILSHNADGAGEPVVEPSESVLELLRGFGALVETGEDGVLVRRGALRGQVIDAAPIPDLIPVLSVLAAGAEGETRIVNAGRLRLKESDRLKTTAALLRDLGGTVEELEDGLVIHGRGSLRGGAVDSAGDHRIAMSAAVASCLCREPVELSDGDCVAKSYPGFWDDFETLRRGS